MHPLSLLLIATTTLTLSTTAAPINNNLNPRAVFCLIGEYLCEGNALYICFAEPGSSSFWKLTEQCLVTQVCSTSFSFIGCAVGGREGGGAERGGEQGRVGGEGGKEGGVKKEGGAEKEGGEKKGEEMKEATQEGGEKKEAGAKEEGTLTAGGNAGEKEMAGKEAEKASKKEVVAALPEGEKKQVLISGATPSLHFVSPSALAAIIIALAY
ncbi:hypothetical protein HDU81_009601 [Chytriomyces hyalinus]|nr:hypothetical protein HDU81_009601 [Chytriomyces hyalinus]